MEVLKISSKSNPNSVAGAIAGLVKESNKAEMQAIGAGALNQAVKAVAIARGFVAPAGVDLICILFLFLILFHLLFNMCMCSKHSRYSAI